MPKHPVRHFRGYLVDLRNQLSLQAWAGKPLEETKRPVNLEKFSKWLGYKRMGKLKIEGMYRMVRGHRVGN